MIGLGSEWSQCGWCRADLIWKQNLKIISNSCALPVRPNLSPISYVECYESFNKIRLVNDANCLFLAFYHFKHFWLISTAQVIECGRPPPAPGQAAGAGDLSFFPFLSFFLFPSFLFLACIFLFLLFPLLSSARGQATGAGGLSLFSFVIIDFY